MSKRKMISVEELKNRVNSMIRANAISMPDNPEGRRTLRILIACALMDTGNYHGFSYTKWFEGGCEQWEADGRPADRTKYLGDLDNVHYH